MAVDASAVARVLGVTTEYQDLRGGNVTFLPQRIAVVGQGATASAGYSTAKWTATSANAVGNRYGYGSPVHLAVRELLPASGDGVGTIPVEILPLNDASGSVAASGTITPSGTVTSTKTYYARVGGIYSNAFAIASGSMDVSDVLREMGQAIAAVPEMPVTKAWTYGSVTAGSCVGTGDGTVTSPAVHSGSQPVPGTWTATCTAAATDAGTFKLVDPNGTVVSTSITVGVAESDTGGLDFTIADGATDYVVGDYFLIEVPATLVTLTSKWKGASANDITIEIVDATGEVLTSGTADANGVVMTIVAMASGASNPTVGTPLTLIGDVWTTMIVNCLNPDDTTALTAYDSWGEGRWGTLVHKPAVVFTGWTGYGDPTYNAAIVVPSARTTQRTNCQLVAPGSPDLPLRVAARQVARIAKGAQNNPPKDYGFLRANGLIPGNDEDQWLYTTRDLAVKGGTSTVEIRDGVVTLSDIVTFYAPTGEDPPAYRYVVDIVRLQNIIYNLSLIFATEEWAGAPLIPDNQPTVNPSARRPKDAKAAIAALLDNLGLQAIISDPETSKAAVTCTINGSNPKRLDIVVPVALSGNTNVKDVTLRFGFYFGGATA